jgi:hypothetical protein
VSPRQITIRALVVGVTLLLGLVPLAGATSFPDERPAHNPTLDAMVAEVGIPFWVGRGLTPCAVPEVMLAPDLGEFVGYADGCRIWIKTEELQAAQRQPRESEPYLCLLVVHELGHTAGLGHSETGVMAAQASEVPWDCHRWVQRRVQARMLRARLARRARRNPVFRVGSLR